VQHVSPKHLPFPSAPRDAWLRRVFVSHSSPKIYANWRGVVGRTHPHIWTIPTISRPRSPVSGVAGRIGVDLNYSNSCGSLPRRPVVVQFANSVPFGEHPVAKRSGSRTASQKGHQYMPGVGERPPSRLPSLLS